MQVHLTTPIEISVNGTIQLSEFLNIEDPNRGNIRDVSKLQEIGASAMMKIAPLLENISNDGNDKTPKVDDENAIAPDVAIRFLKMGQQYSDAIKAFDDFILNYAKLDEMRLKSGTLSRMSLTDYENALGEYFGKYCFLK